MALDPMADDALTDDPTPAAVEAQAAKDEQDDALWDVHSEKAGVPEDADGLREEPSAPVVTADRNADGTFGKKAKPRNNPQARVQQATADAAEARRQLAERDAELAQLRAERAAPTKPAATSAEPTRRDVAEQRKTANFYGDDVTRPFPDIKEFGDDPDPVARMFYEGAKWINEQDRYQTTKQTAQAERHTMLTEASQRLADAHASDPAFHGYVQAIEREILRSRFQGERVDGTTGPAFPPALFTAMAKSSRIADITRLFGQHPEQCAQWIADTRDLPPSAATVVLRSLEASLPRSAAAARSDSAPLALVSAAKAPISRVGGSANATPVDEDELSDDEWFRQENAKDAQARAKGQSRRW